jgi:CHAT domain-containing protein
MTIPLAPGTPLAAAVSRAVAAEDAAAADAAYRDAMGLAPDEITTALARDHIAALASRCAYSLAHRRCTEYLESFPDDRPLRLTQAEILCALAAASDAEQLAEAIGALPAATDRARLHRIRGLAAVDRDDYDSAARHFEDARALFASSGDAAGDAAIARDVVVLGIRRGDPQAVATALAWSTPQTPAQRLQLALALRRDLRYEEAVRVLRDAGDVDPRLRSVINEEVAELQVLLCEDNPVYATGLAADPDSPRFDRRLLHARLLVMRGREQATERPAESAVLAQRSESVLRELWPRAGTEGQRAAWHLAAGELELARSHLFWHAGASDDRVGSVVQEAERHLRRAAALAATRATAEVRQLALRLLGRARMQLGAGEEAIGLWHDAFRIEECIAARQPSDDVRARMLLAASDERDEWITWEANAIGRHGAIAAAAVAVAMESTRGRTIATAIGGDHVTPPRPGDLAGAGRWVREMTRDLPRDQVVWLMHATAEAVHHVLLGRTILQHYSARHRTQIRNQLDRAITTLASFGARQNLERSVRTCEFDTALTAISELLDIGPVLWMLPKRVTRAAVVAYGILSRIPLAALPVPGTADRLVHRLAVSDLPSLSVRRPLARRGRRRRGDRSLLVQPNPIDDGDDAGLSRRSYPKLTRATHRPPGDVLDGDEARPGRLSATLPGYRIVRIDSHGSIIDHEPTLQLSPAGPAGWLRPSDLALMDLSDCGTLMLGACDSAVTTTVGRDEALGLVRSALRVGAAAVVAARWVADDEIAAGLLDRFEHHLQYLPRDVALQRAQLDTCAGWVPHGGTPEHPARWACWTLHGDSGRQTGAGPVRRWLRSTGEQGGVMQARMKRPKVFLSFAGNDRAMAERLAADLLPYNIETFIDVRDVPPGASLLQSVGQAMGASDYCVLLWSHNCACRPWVDLELDMAYSRQLNERRAFLFVVRLDRSELPLLLSVRRYLDAFLDWPAVSRALATHWRCDLATGTPVVPAPALASPTPPTTIAVPVRNLALGISHMVGVAPDSSGADLLPTVRAALALPDVVSQLNGTLELRFGYRLLLGDEEVRPDRSLAEQGVVDCTQLDLEIRVQAKGPDGPIGERIYRGPDDELPGVSELSTRSAVFTAFKHLLP